MAVWRKLLDFRNE